jgi:hypothetical protein
MANAFYDKLVSHYQTGEADIDKEILSQFNDKYVLHDSKGFEPGEDINFETVRDFIKRRNKESALKDRLHAIWCLHFFFFSPNTNVFSRMCLETPVAGSRIEAGDENFFRLKREGEFGSGTSKYSPLASRLIYLSLLLVPVIAVFTKYDALVNSKERKYGSKNARANAEEAFQRECISPFQEIVGDEIPFIAVSGKQPHSFDIQTPN